MDTMTGEWLQMVLNHTIIFTLAILAGLLVMGAVVDFHSPRYEVRVDSDHGAYIAGPVAALGGDGSGWAIHLSCDNGEPWAWPIADATNESDARDTIAGLPSPDRYCTYR